MKRSDVSRIKLVNDVKPGKISNFQEKWQNNNNNNNNKNNNCQNGSGKPRKFSKS